MTVVQARTRMSGLCRVSGLGFLSALMMVLLGSDPIMAQGSGDEDSVLEANDLSGIQRGAVRSWAGDFAALTSPDTTDASEIGILVVTGMVLEFDSADHAAEAFDLAAAENAAGSDGIVPTPVAAETVGDQSLVVTSPYPYPVGGEDGTAIVALAQQGNRVVLSMVVGYNGDLIGAATAFAQDLLTGKVGDGDGDFNDDGTSSGGLWDVFPDDAEYLRGLTVYADEDPMQSNDA